MVQFENAVRRFGELVLFDLKKEGITCWIAGGAVRDYFLGIKIVTDYDIFFPEEKDYLLSKKYFEEREALVIFENENVLKIKYKGRKYDLIKKYFKSPQASIEEFDFTVSMFAIDTEKVYFGESSFIDLAKKQIIINKIIYPASTLSRAFKYYKKGFSMCQGEIKKLFLAIQDTPKTENKETGEPEIDVLSGDFGVSGFFTGVD